LLEIGGLDTGLAPGCGYTQQSVNCTSVALRYSKVMHIISAVNVKNGLVLGPFLNIDKQNSRVFITVNIEQTRVSYLRGVRSLGGFF